MAVDRFELMRQRTKQQGTADVQNQTDAMKRRFAAAGGLSSGASMKAENQVEQAGAMQVGQNLQGIDIAQAQEQFQTEEQQKQRDYGSAEAEKQRQFASAERLGSQQFASGEREAAQKYQSAEAGINRALQQDMFNKEYGLKRQQFQESKNQFNKTYGLQVRQLGHEEEVDAFNRTMAERIQRNNEKPGLMDKITGFASESGGFNPGAFVTGKALSVNPTNVVSDILKNRWG